MSTSIFLGAGRARSADRVSLRPPSSSSASALPALDARLLAILNEPIAAHETAMEGFKRKERELAAVFGGLSILESRALYLRLSNPHTEDALATRFSRLTIERRQRLLEFLADARRRAALAAAGGR